MACTVCDRDIKIVAKGLCGACYQRKQKRGTTDYAPVRVRGTCKLAGCDRPHAARGYCDLHHQRVLETGDPETTKRPDCWGAKIKHPLYQTWQRLGRFKSVAAFAPEWEDFLQFIADVGPRPWPRAMLYAADDTLPIGPSNFVWKKAISQRGEGEDEATFKRRRARVYRKVRNEQFEGYELNQHYGLTRERLALMQEAQGGVCAICLRPEQSTRYKRLSIDHCHKTGRVRGLLCNVCNKALGAFNDDIVRLRNAIIYLTETAKG